jgi:hypothetical protein
VNNARVRIVLRFPSAVLLCLFSILPCAPARQSVREPVSGQNSASKTPAAPWPEGFQENFKSIGLDGSTLQPQKPVLVERVAPPDSKYVRERIRVCWRPRDAFDLYVTLPKGVKKPPVILYLYSFPEGAGRFQSAQWYDGTVIDGYAAVGFVSALTAERAENRYHDEWFVRLLPESMAASVHDVQMILDYLTSREDLDMDRVGMFGTGSGGAIAILASAADPRIKAIDVFNPWGDWPDWMAKSWVIPEDDRQKGPRQNKYLDPQFLEIAAPLDPIRWLPKAKAQSLRIQYVRSEATMPLEAQKKIEEVAPDYAEINLFGNYRAWMSVERGLGIFSWMRQALQPDAKPRLVADKSKRVHFFTAEGASTEPTPARP